MKTKHFIPLSLLFLFTAINAIAQPSLVLPEVSQLSEVKQRIGYTDITIVYHSPYVNGRTIWGELVPYGKVWRAGANENTTISFTDDVSINGSPLLAGTYGLHMIPGNDEWTIIFSKDHTSWGSFFYSDKEDALRVKTKPAPHPFQEWLDYTFTNRSATSATATLSWEKLAVPFTISVDVKAIALKCIREQLKNQPGFGWHGWEEAAHYCIENKFNYDEALKWVNTSIQIDENFTNVAAKGQLLRLMGNTKAADSSAKRVLTLAETAGETSINQFGYELMNENDMPTALEIFKINLKRHPDSWNAYDSMGEAFGKAGDNKQSLSNYKTALSKAPDDQKERIKKIIASLQK
jgi:hypothetical protein